MLMIDVSARLRSSWNQWWFKLRERLSHLVSVIERRVCFEVSVAL